MDLGVVKLDRLAHERPVESGIGTGRAWGCRTGNLNLPLGRSQKKSAVSLSQVHSARTAGVDLQRTWYSHDERARPTGIDARGSGGAIGHPGNTCLPWLTWSRGEVIVRVVIVHHGVSHFQLPSCGCQAPNNQNLRTAEQWQFRV